MAAPTPPNRPLLSLRSVVILSLSTLIAIVAGALSFLNHGSVPSALLIGGAAWAGSLAVMNQITGD